MQFNPVLYLEAQESSYQKALDEIREGRKRSHWMWYIFPQLKGLGVSEMSRYYGISGAAEARDYLAHPILGARLREISYAVSELKSDDATEVMGWPDDLKLRSCMTLFAFVSGDEDSVFNKVLDKYFGGKPDYRTIEMLESVVE